MIVVKQEIEDYLYINIKQRYLNWTSSKKYAFGDIVFKNKYYYRNVIDDNIGISPIDSPEWLLWEVSNRYGQLDLHSTTYTTWNSTTTSKPTDTSMIVQFTSNNYDILAMGRTHASKIRVTVHDKSGVQIFREQKDSYPRPNSNNWYGYFFDKFLGAGEKEAWYFNIPSVQDGIITVEAFPDDSGDAKVGFMIGGRSSYAGDTLFGLSTGIEDNSIWNTDDFGIITVAQRDASEALDLDVQYSSVRTNEIKIAVRDVVGEIVLFIGDEQKDSKYDHLMILGKIDSFTPVIANPIITKASFSVSEVL